MTHVFTQTRFELRLIGPLRVVSFLIFLSLSVTVTAFAQPSEMSASNVEAPTPFKPNVAPRLDVPEISGKISIDGTLDEAAWATAAMATNFTEFQPNENGKPPIGIKTYMAYDSENLYVAYVIQDDPLTIRAHLNDRDQIWQDDYAGMLLDTQGDGQVTYFISSNPYGIQGDTRSAIGQQEDMGFDLIYDSAGKITETGYQIEMAIPFRSLRFPKADIQEWKATFWITRPRGDRSQYSWAAIDRADPCMACQFGTLAGISGIKTGRNIEILPAITGSQTGNRDFGNPVNGFDNRRMTAEPSLNLKYGISSNLTADVTINPDFSQIESDVAQIDVNSAFALSFPERRAFFQEGADIFSSRINAVYTRSINDPLAAAKLTGRAGSWSFGYISARDNTSPIMVPLEESSRLVSGGKSVSNILRARRSFENNSFVAAMVTDRRLDDGGSGSLLGIDGSIRFKTKYSASWQLLYSQTNEMNNAKLSAESGLNGRSFDRGNYTGALDGESFSGHALDTKIERTGRNYGADINYVQLSPTFRADNGFIPNNDARRVNIQNRYTFYVQNSAWVSRMTVFAGVNRFWNFDNVRKDESIFTGFFAQMGRQTFVNGMFFASNELYAGKQFTQLNRANIRVNSNFSQRMQVGMRGEFGNAIYRNPAAPEVGYMFSGSADVTVRATDRMTIGSSINYAELTDKQTKEKFYSGYILRSRVNYQFSRKLLSRVIVQYNDFTERLEIDPLVTYRVSPFTVVHLGSSHRFEDFPAARDGQPMLLQQTNRQFFFKLQYLLRV